MILTFWVNFQFLSFFGFFCFSLFKKGISLNLRLEETHSEPCQTSKLKRLAKIFDGFQSLTIFAIFFILQMFVSILNITLG